MSGTAYTLPEIAREAGVSESTCRRYVKNFSDFIPMESRGRVNLYGSDAIPVLKRVKELYDAGFNTSEIGVALAQEFSRTIETSPVTSGGDHSRVGDLPDTKGIVNELVEQLQNIKSRDADIVKIKQFLVNMKKQLQEVEAGRKEMPSFENIRYILNRLKSLEKRVEILEKKDKNQ